MNHSDDNTAPGLPESFEASRVDDVRFARAYDKTGDRGRALIKSCIARLFEINLPGSPVAASRTDRFASGGARSEFTAARPWYALALDPDCASPSQLVAAVMPALAARIPQVLVFRPKGRGPWPHALLTALELCGVEQVFSPTFKDLKQHLSVLRGQMGDGGLACLGSQAFCDRIQALFAPGRAHWLRPPRALGLLAESGLDWDREALAFAHAGVPVREYTDAAMFASAGHEAVFAPASLAPLARLTFEPGCEFLWDWPDLPRELFFGRRLVYS